MDVEHGGDGMPQRATRFTKCFCVFCASLWRITSTKFTKHREESMKTLLVGLFLFVQSQNARLGGTVSDAAGALIPGVEVTATNDGTGIVTTVVSNETGVYQFASLQPGTYTVTSTLPGFQTQTYKQVALSI